MEGSGLSRMQDTVIVKVDLLEELERRLAMILKRVKRIERGGNPDNSKASLDSTTQREKVY